MSNLYEREAEDLYERDNDHSPVTSSFTDNSYAKETNRNLRDQVPVQSDQAGYADPIQPPYSNTDAQLAQDEEEVAKSRNILQGDRLRHAKPQTRNRYNEGPNEDELPAEVQ